MLRNHPYLPEDLQEALEHLASIDLIDLCNEAKVERCRATRDLRSCGRYVMDVLISCGHASLCAECSQRCDVCPICRIPIPKNGKKLRRRLYDQCSEARLISKKRFQEKEDGEEHISADVQRLYSLFDVALENNLVSLICHYVTDVCLDESAVSSDPVIAFLLDEVVVKDWCKRTFQNIITELQGIYNLETEQMKSMLSALLKFSAQLAGISNVLDVLDSSFKGSLSAQLQDLHQLQESILKTTQHMEAMIWCLRHEFLENVRPSNANFTLWCSLVRERKSAAIKRSWPDAVNNSEEPTGQEGTLFIEDALVNLEIEQGNTVKLVEELKLASLQKDGVSSIFSSEIGGVAGCYPFENVRAAVDILFLCGSSDLVVAKQAIFLYYLFDRHWTMPDEQWRHIVEDFGATFGIPRHLLLESLIFYLLDDHTDEALQEACHLLPEISGPATHPKIAQVLLERGNPDTALSVLRWSGRDGTSKPISLSEAVTAVRVRVECGLFTEAFIHQRMLCTKVKEKKLKCGQFGDVTDDSTFKYRGWEDWVEILVTEICVLCIRRNMVDRMIELPWNSDEEKHLHKCLLDYTIDDPSSIIGSLLVVFYIQRYRYSEAYHVDQILKNAEQEFISKNSVSEEVLSRMRSMSGWRTGLIDKCMELLPEVQRQQVKAGKFLEISGATSSEVEISATCPLPEVQVSKSTSLLIPSSVDISHALWMDRMNPSWKSSISETPQKRVALVDSYRSDLGNHGSSVLHERLFTISEMQWKPDNSINKSFNFEDASTPEIHWDTPSSAVKGGSRSSFKLLSNSHLQDNQYDKMSPETEKNRSFNPFRNTSPLHYYSANSNPVTTPSSNNGQFKDSAMNPHRVSSKAYYPDRDDRPWDMVSKDDSMDISLSYGEKSFGIEDRNLNHGPRWRSDETSDEEEEQSPQKAIDITHHTPTSTTRGVRRSRFSKR